MAYICPYLVFKDNAREALEYYHSVLGGDLQIMAFGDMAAVAEGMGANADEAKLVMHGQLTLPNSQCIMASDTGNTMPYVPATRGMSIALTGLPEDFDYIQKAFNALREGATDIMEFAAAPWGAYYGQLTDKYGISWVFNANK